LPILPEGVETTLDAARSAVSFSLQTQDDSLANPSNLSQVWLDSNQDMVALIYGEEAIHVLEFPAPYSDPKGTYEQKVQEGVKVESGVGRVRGERDRPNRIQRCL
jgi:hypothetical protein